MLTQCQTEEMGDVIWACFSLDIQIDPAMWTNMWKRAQTVLCECDGTSLSNFMFAHAVWMKKPEQALLDALKEKAAGEAYILSSATLEEFQMRFKIEKAHRLSTGLTYRNRIRHRTTPAGAERNGEPCLGLWSPGNRNASGSRKTDDTTSEMAVFPHQQQAAAYEHRATQIGVETSTAGTPDDVCLREIRMRWETVLVCNKCTTQHCILVCKQEFASSVLFYKSDQAAPSECATSQNDVGVDEPEMCRCGGQHEDVPQTVIPHHLWRNIRPFARIDHGSNL